ncbi:ABC transporter permease [Dactylosporangium sp. NPDC005572]|uniref:ABC transporter permease n=1 Tax=Dactylosporangium sp. NPDC005572 TaxID=3156889 RepID=UPI0033ABE1C4
MIRSMLLRRIAGGLAIMWLVSVIVFLAIHVLPGDARDVLLGQEATPEQYAALTRELGLDRPLVDQYLSWMGGLLTGDWGSSLVSTLPVSELVTTKLGYTGLLTLSSLILIVPLSILIGAYSAIRHGGLFDSIVTVVTLVFSAVPGFAVAILVIYVLCTNVLHLLPAASIFDPTRPTAAQLDMVVAPTIAVVLSMIAYPIRMIRASMIEVLDSDYVMLARLKGQPEHRVIFRHALRNVRGAIVQANGLTLLFISGGIVFVETVFSYPGVGYGLVQAVSNRDVPVLQTLVVILAAICVIINLLTDLAIIAVTPRLRTRIAHSGAAS